MLIKLEWLGYRAVKNTMTICKAVFIQYRNVTDRRTDRQTNVLYQYRESVCWRAIKITKNVTTKWKTVKNLVHVLVFVPGCGPVARLLVLNQVWAMWTCSFRFCRRPLRKASLRTSRRSWCRRWPPILCASSRTCQRPPWTHGKIHWTTQQYGPSCHRSLGHEATDRHIPPGRMDDSSTTWCIRLLHTLNTAMHTKET